MESPKLYTIDHDGYYTINFPNRHALTNEEIKNKIIRFAKVVSIRCAGDAKGFRFVRLASLEDTLNVIKGLKNDHQIKLVVRKPKEKNGSKNVSNDSKNGYTRNKMQNNSNTNSASNSKIHSPNSVKSQKSSKSSKDQRMNVKLEQCHQLRDAISEQFVPFNNISNIPSLMQTIPFVETEMPTLIPKSCKIEENQSTEVNVILATELIIANIHDNYGTAFLLHLLERFDPISITKINIEPVLNFRYCHVYFKNEKDAEEAAQNFDDYTLLGKKLIAVRTQF